MSGPRRTTRRGWLLALLLAPGCGMFGDGPRSVPTVPVVREVFVREVGAEGNLRAVDATQLSSPKESNGPMKIAWLAADGARVEAGDLVVLFDDTDAKKAQTDGEADLGAAQKELAKERLQSGQAIRQRERTAELAGQEMETSETFQSRDAAIYSRNQLASSQIDSELAQARLQHADRSRAIEEQLAGSKIDLLELASAKAQLAIDRAQATLGQLEVRAPHAGMVVLKANRRGDVPQVGDSVWPGQRLAELPQLDKLEAQLFVLEADAAGLEAELPAVVFLDAHPGTEWPARIKKVDTLAKPRQQGAPLQYFETIVALDTVDPALMKPGQRVHATLSLGGQEALVVPRQAVFERDGESVAWRKVGEGFEPTPITLGVSSPGRVTVEDGLSEGDEVAVQDPERGAEAERGEGETP